MAEYKCSICGYVYNEESEGTTWDDLSSDWTCPICGVDQSLFDKKEDTSTTKTVADETTKSDETATNTSRNIEETTSLKADEMNLDEYLQEWAKSSDPHETQMNEIHQMAKTGESVMEPMRTTKPLFSWNDILIKGAQLARLPLEKNEEVTTETIIGVKAKQPLIIKSPVIISHMSFGALSREFKEALAKGSAAANTAICSGEGGILPEELNSSYKYIFEYVPNEYSVSEENLKRVDAIEIKIGQGVKPGMGGHLPGEKVTQEIAEIRGKEIGKDIHSPSSFKDIKNEEELRQKINWLREKSGGKPIGVKIAAGDVENDLAVILPANPDFITIDGRGGATGSAPKFVKDNTTVPTLFALHRAKEYLLKNSRTDIAIIITGGLRLSGDFAKAIAMGATAVAIATAAMIAGGCQQFRICNTGNCPVGIATQDPELRKRIDIAKSAKRIENYLKACNRELEGFARLTGHRDIHDLSLDDLCTTNSEISGHTKIKHV